jgi:Protein of unknown function (DUF1501)
MARCAARGYVGTFTGTLTLSGLNHEKLTFSYAGRDFRLTDVSGRVVKGIIA